MKTFNKDLFSKYIEKLVIYNVNIFCQQFDYVLFSEQIIESHY